MIRSRVFLQARAASRLAPGKLPAQSRIPPFAVRQTSTSSSPSGSSLVFNGTIAGALLLAAAYAYSIEKQKPDPFIPRSDPSDVGGDTFEINLGSGRRRQTHSFTRLPNTACESKLHEHEASHTVGRAGNPVIRWDRNWLGSNEPCEDRSAVDLVPRGKSARDMKSGTAEGQEGQKDLVLFSIIDGHGGWATSELLSKVLHPTLTLSLAALQAGIVPGHQGWLAGIMGKINPGSWGAPVWTQANVTQAISSAYTQLDDNIVRTPVQLIPTLRNSPTTPADASLPTVTPRQTLAALAEPADNGACSLSAVVDAEEGDLYVAIAGDCRAVAGWEKNGVWRCDVLTEDQMGENQQEVDRMRKEHPGEEDTVIMRGRVHGGLQPTRAFGDASYKWTQGEAAVICDALTAEGKKARRPRPCNKTPPYVTARPEITHRKIKGQDGEKLRFMIMATDGLWDRITSEESTLLVASYLRHASHSEIHKSTLPQQFPLAPYASEAERPYPAEPLPGSAGRSNGTWVYEGDVNAATHLIRNSLGGGDRKGRNELLSVNGEVTRWLRDDITVTVVFFDDDVTMGQASVIMP